MEGDRSIDPRNIHGGCPYFCGDFLLRPPLTCTVLGPSRCGAVPGQGDRGRFNQSNQRSNARRSASNHDFISSRVSWRSQVFLKLTADPLLRVTRPGLATRAPLKTRHCNWSERREHPLMRLSTWSFARTAPTRTARGRG